MKSFNQFIKESKSDIDTICKKYDITNYTINSDGSIDVDGSVSLGHRNLKKLPLKFRNVSGDFYCSYNNLTSLEDAPESVGGDFLCYYNNELTSLKGSPKIVGGYFICTDNKLTSLEGVPESVDNFYCYNNQLKSLKGCPKRVDIFYCSFNQIRDFNGISEFFEGQFHCVGNPIYEIYDLFDDTKCIKWINEFDVIQGDKVILDRLEEVFHQLNMDIPDNIYFENYEII